MSFAKEVYKKTGLIVISVFLVAFSLYHPPIKILPDYEKTMKHIALSIDQSFLEGDDLQKTPLEPLLDALGEIDIYLFSKIKSDTLPTFLQENVIENIDSANNFWIQDSFEVINKDTIIIPNNNFLVFNPEINFKDFSLLRKEIVKTPFYFEGGNTFIVRLPNNTPAIILGYGSVIKTVDQLELYKELPQAEAEKLVSTNIKKFFWKKFRIETIFLGDKIEDTQLFHIDQTMIFLDNKNVVLAQYTGEKFLNIKEQLKRYEEKLIQLGYNITYLSYDDEIIESRSYYLNGLIFMRGKNKKIVFPSFSSYSNNQKIIASLKNLLPDYETIFIEDTFFHQYSGGFHCVINPLT